MASKRKQSEVLMQSTSLIEYTRGPGREDPSRYEADALGTLRGRRTSQPGLSVEAIASRVDTSAARGVLSANQTSPPQDGGNDREQPDEAQRELFGARRHPQRVPTDYIQARKIGGIDSQPSAGRRVPRHNLHP